MRGVMDVLYPAFDNGDIKPVIDRVFSFDELAEAKRFFGQPIPLRLAGGLWA